MKVRNLLLASLAVAAMTACSNDEEFIDNNKSVSAEDASMSLKFAFSTDTRSVTDGGTNAGDEIEWSATKVTVVLDYGDAKPIIVENLSTITNEENNLKVAETASFSVKAGASVKLYAFINPGELNYASGVKSLVTTATDFPATGLDYLVDGVAADRSFMMSNTNGEPVVMNIISGIENKATINVERVCAKIDEMTEVNKKFTLTSQTAKGPKASVVMSKQTYVNLAKASYVLKQTPCWAAANENVYYNQYTTEKPNYNWISGNTSTYCHENIIDGSWNINKQTSVLYEAQVYFDDEKTPAATFYVKENPETNQKEIFRTWTALTDKYNGLKESENEEDMKNFSIEKYAEGKCYYQAPIEDTTAGVSIVRNHWYQLTVSNVRDLGYPTPVPPTPDNTKLTVKVQMEPWKIQVNDIIL